MQERSNSACEVRIEQRAEGQVEASYKDTSGGREIAILGGSG